MKRILNNKYDEIYEIIQRKNKDDINIKKEKEENVKIQLIKKYENEIIKIKNINKELLKSLATSKKENKIMSLEYENKIKYIEKEYERILKAKSLEFEYNKEKMENDNKLEIERIISEYEDN